jgi:hypothetical protein
VNPSVGWLLASEEICRLHSSQLTGSMDSLKSEGQESSFMYWMVSKTASGSSAVRVQYYSGRGRRINSSVGVLSRTIRAPELPSGCQWVELEAMVGRQCERMKIQELEEDDECQWGMAL